MNDTFWTVAADSQLIMAEMDEDILFLRVLEPEELKASGLKWDYRAEEPLIELEPEHEPEPLSLDK